MGGCVILWCMRNIISTLLMVMLCVGVCMPMVAQAESDAGKQILQKVVDAGAKALQNKRDKKEPKVDNPEQSADSKGLDLATITKSLLTPGGIADIVRKAVIEAMKGIVEQYKEEGREYARQLGDVLTERMMQNPKIQSTFFMIKALVWAVLLYLTVISLLLVYMLHKLQVSNRRIVALLEERSGS